MLQCRHEGRDGGSRHLRIAITLATRVTLTTVIARVPRRTLLQCWHETLDGGCRPLEVPITVARATVIARAPRRTMLSVDTKPEMVAPDISRFQSHSHTPSRARYSDRTCPETYVAIVLTRNPRWWLPTSRDSNHTRTPSHPRYSDRTRPDAYCATVSSRE